VCASYHRAVLTIRPATEDDAHRLFEWANDPGTRANSFNGDPIQWDTHTAWLAAILNDPQRSLYILEAPTPAGVVRLDRGATGVEVSITIAPDRRGEGLAKAALKAICVPLTVPQLAWIKPRSEASRRAFVGAGFVLAETFPDRLLYVHDGFARAAALNGSP